MTVLLCYLRVTVCTVLSALAVLLRVLFTLCGISRSRLENWNVLSWCNYSLKYSFLHPLRTCQHAKKTQLERPVSVKFSDWISLKEIYWLASDFRVQHLTSHDQHSVKTRRCHDCFSGKLRKMASFRNKLTQQDSLALIFAVSGVYIPL